VVRIERNVSELSRPFDVVIVGGGITGVSIARETAGRGLRTLLVEKGDFGEGTSSATSKFIHGGIRYLEQYQFAVVRESLRERRILGLAAPHLVNQTRFVMPAWKWSKPGAPLIGAGVALYRALGFDSNKDAPDSLRVPNPRWLSKETVLRDIPWLNGDQLQGAWAYHDTMNVHPERLLLAFLQSAVSSGAVALNHMRADGFVTAARGQETLVEGVHLVDSLTGERHTVRSRTIVNAGGPWMDLVLGPIGRQLGVGVNRSKGVHLLTRALGGSDAVFARARSGHHVIVSQWQGHSFIGPTDTPMGDTDPDDVAVDATDVRLILDTVNDTISPTSATGPLTEEDIEAVTVGIRPLVLEEGKGDTYKASRKAELYDHGERGVHHLYSIGGGKWTTGRAIAVDVAEKLLASPALEGVATHHFDSTRLAAFGTFAWAEDAEPFLEQAARSRPELGMSHDVRLHLARLYGTEHERVLDLVAADHSLGRRISERAGVLDIAAQAVFAVSDEGARTLGDVLHRRLVIGTFGPATDAELFTVADLIHPLLGWDDATRAAQISIEQRQRLALEALRTRAV